jgi:hypothetical protein
MSALRLTLVALLALAWAALDVREVVHQLDESHAGVAIAASVLHLAAEAIAGVLAARVSAPRRPGTMAA